MQVDHFAPVYLFGDNTDAKNLMPSCRKCNYYKNTFTIKKFKENIKEIPNRLIRDSFIFNIALNYGIIKIDFDKINNLPFYYELVENNKQVDED